MAYSGIAKAGLHFNTKLYTGNAGTQAVTGVGFQPDWVWLKHRNGSTNHNIFDAVRGVQKLIEINTGVEQTTTDKLSAFGTDGFTLGSNGGINGSGGTYVSWNWKGAGSTSANSDGATNSTVSVNATAGFSIVSYVGTGSQTTVGHGLGATPDVIFVKNRDTTEDWSVYHSANGAGYYQAINTTEAASSNNNRFNVAPTSSVFTVNTHHSVNKSGDNIIAYCFASKKGFSKFRSYTGNGNSDGSFVYTGFKPAFVIYKGAGGANSVDNWEVADNKRSEYNPIQNVLYPNLSNAEGTGVTTRMDMLSNGFKMRTNGTDYNGNGQTYIYMAFAEEPLVANVGQSIPATAR